MKTLRLSHIIFFFALLILFTALPETTQAMVPPARRSYHHKHYKRYKRSYHKRYSRKRTTIPKDYIIRNSRRYKIW